MGIFEDLYIKARSKLYGLSKKAGKYLDISKLKIKIAECEKDIEIKHQKIGEIVYNKIINDEIFDKIDVLELVNDINNLKEDMHDYTEKINSLKGKCICKFCNSLNNEGSQFCSTCGNSLRYAESPDSTSGVVVDMKNDSSSSEDSVSDVVNDSTDFSE